MVVRDTCPPCGSTYFKKNGHIHSGKQNHQRKACGRQFVASAEGCTIPNEQRTLIEHLLRERISLRDICRAVGASLTWLLSFMVERFATRLAGPGLWSEPAAPAGPVCDVRPLDRRNGRASQENTGMTRAPPAPGDDGRRDRAS